MLGAMVRLHPAPTLTGVVLHHGDRLEAQVLHVVCPAVGEAGLYNLRNNTQGEIALLSLRTIGVLIVFDFSQG